MKQRTKVKTNKGITLIALVITIIVLLILAGVAIATLTGDNGILNQAGSAKEKTEKAEVIERARTDVLGVQAGNNGEITKGQFKTILDTYFKDVPQDYTQDTELETKEEYGNYKIKVSEIYSGNLVERGITASEIANAEDKSQYYGAEVKGYDCINSAGVNTWKIFYADENNIYIIADDYIPIEYCPAGKSGGTVTKGTLYPRGASFGGVYGDYAGSSDITDAKIKALNNDYFTKGYTSTNTNMKLVAYMLDTNAWSGFAGEKAEYAIGGPTVEMLMKSYSQKYGVDYRAQASSLRGYQISTDGGNNWNNYSSECLNTTDSLYVINSTSNAYGMWLASPSNFYEDYVMFVTCYGSVHNNGYPGTNFGFRPLVCLQSDIQLQKNADGSYTIK